MKRKIIEINEKKCNGCGLCIPNCAEGALQIIDGKARLISDLFCDGLGACIGHCPEGAIDIIEREAKEYDEIKVLEHNIIPAGINTINAHLKHLKNHNETKLLNQAIEYLKSKKIDFQIENMNINLNLNSCPGASVESFTTNYKNNNNLDSELSHWPIQLHLIMPNSLHFNKCDLLLAADCTAFSYGNTHKDFIKNKKLIIACPKLDNGKDMYIKKIISLIDDTNINTLTILRMQVPCCGGLTTIAKQALSQSKRKIPLKEIVISIKGEIIKEEWL